MGSVLITAREVVDVETCADFYTRTYSLDTRTGRMWIWIIMFFNLTLFLTKKNNKFVFHFDLPFLFPCINIDLYHIGFLASR